MQIFTSCTVHSIYLTIELFWFLAYYNIKHKRSKCLFNFDNSNKNMPTTWRRESSETEMPDPTPFSPRNREIGIIHWSEFMNNNIFKSKTILIWLCKSQFIKNINQKCVSFSWSVYYSHFIWIHRNKHSKLQEKAAKVQTWLICSDELVLFGSLLGAYNVLQHLRITKPRTRL